MPAGTRIDELEGAIRTVCEPYFDRPLKEISLGMVLMRLFQTSRRFHVEIQPQLVLLQKTLLNIEGLGRQLDPDLDLWNTAKPFLEKWMADQIGPRKLFEQLRAEAPRYAKLLPQLPRLMHDFLENRPGRPPARTDGAAGRSKADQPAAAGHHLRWHGFCIGVDRDAGAGARASFLKEGDFVVLLTLVIVYLLLTIAIGL